MNTHKSIHITPELIATAEDILKKLAHVAEQYGLQNLDSALTFLQDASVANAFEYDEVNIDRNGADAWDSNGIREYEGKNSYIKSKNIGATFNDTSYEKLDAFGNENLFLGSAIWGAEGLMCVAYGPMANIVDELRRQRNHQEISQSRKTQRIDFKNLVLNYGFSIVAIADVDAVKKMLRRKFDGSRSQIGTKLCSAVVPLEDYVIPNLTLMAA